MLNLQESASGLVVKGAWVKAGDLSHPASPLVVVYFFIFSISGVSFL
jgi:hypothetical protein